jgi:heat shock protein HtpX
VLTSLTHDEVEAILAHEICHIEKGHAGILTFMQGVMLPITLPLALMINSMFSRFFGSSSFKTKLLRTNSLLSFICFPLTSIVLLLFSRYWEYEADACASSLVGKEQYLQALRCLHGSFFQHANLPGAFNSIANSARVKTQSQGGGLSHPSLAQRINALQEIGS